MYKSSINFCVIYLHSCTSEESCSDSENGDSAPPPASPTDESNAMTDGAPRALVSWLVTFFCSYKQGFMFEILYWK